MGTKKYNPLTHNCQEYKVKVNIEYGKIAKSKGLPPKNGPIDVFR